MWGKEKTWWSPSSFVCGCGQRNDTSEILRVVGAADWNTRLPDPRERNTGLRENGEYRFCPAAA